MKERRLILNICKILLQGGTFQGKVYVILLFPEQAETIFREMFPTEEFCPAPPNPEDIIYDEDEIEPEESGLNNSPETKPEASAEENSSGDGAAVAKEE